jgi:serine/threonine-protein phosphatase PGAM5
MWSNVFVRSAHRHLPTTVFATGVLLTVSLHNNVATNRVTSTESSSTQQQQQQQQQQPKEEEDTHPLLFQGQCLERQLYKPQVPYPAWDYNWDGRMTDDTSLEGHRSGKEDEMADRNNHKTRHIILVRHGQYDETYQDDSVRKLTELGRIQARKTGQRLAELARGSMEFRASEDVDPWYCGPLIKTTTTTTTKPNKIRVSNMTRAKETAELIAEEMRHHHLPTMIQVDTPDPKLNEGLPAPMIPIRPDIAHAEEEIDAHHDRIEEAFQTYFYRDTTTAGDDDDDDDDHNIDNNPHEFEIIVCHANVIRYFFCRALQLPPEAWLRMSIFNCSLTYLTIRPNGNVSARMLGDIGHLRYNESTFSGNYGFKW